MKQASQPLGPLALAFGACAIPCVAVATFLERTIGLYGSEVLMFLDRYGLVASVPTSEPPRFERADFLVLNDVTATALLLWTGLYLAACALGIALWAEARGEDNLYIASGAACSSMALLLFSAPLGLLSIACSTALVLSVRKWRKVREQRTAVLLSRHEA